MRMSMMMIRMMMMSTMSMTMMTMTILSDDDVDGSAPSECAVSRAERQNMLINDPPRTTALLGAHCIMHTAVHSVLHLAPLHCLMHTAVHCLMQCTIHTAQCTLHRTTTLRGAHCMMHCTVHTAQCVPPHSTALNGAHMVHLQHTWYTCTCYTHTNMVLHLTPPHRAVWCTALNTALHHITLLLILL